MDEFTVWGIPGSPFMRAVLATLNEKGLPWRLEALRPGEHRSPAHVARHPFGRVPALTQGDFTLYETQAILRHLDRITPKPALTPTDPRAAARMDQVMNIIDWYLFRDIGIDIIFCRVVAPRLGLPIDDSRVAGAMPKAAVCMAELARLLGDAPYFGGQAVSLADLHAAPHASYLRDCQEGRDLLAPHANLRDWIERMEARPSMAATTWDQVNELARAA